MRSALCGFAWQVLSKHGINLQIDLVFEEIIVILEHIIVSDEENHSWEIAMVGLKSRSNNVANVITPTD